MSLQKLVISIVLAGAWTQSAGANPIAWKMSEGGNDHYYMAVAVPSGISWVEANQEASLAGGYLVSITSKAENDFVYGLISDDIYWNGNLGPCIGLYQIPGSLEPHRGWRWISEEPLSYTNWRPGQPNQAQNTEENCAHYYVHSALWNDTRLDRNDLGGYVVEFNQYSDSWTYLFDGQTLDGWVQRGGDALYYVDNGAIIGETSLNTPNSFLCTDVNYANFILELDFIVDNELNSGIQIRSESRPDYKNGRVHGYQVEIDPSLAPYSGDPKNLLANGMVAPPNEPRSWSGGIYDEARRGWLYDLTRNEAARNVFIHGDWNHYRIEAIGDSIRTWVNGVPAADLVDDMTSSGFIGLQVHSSQIAGLTIAWKNIKIQVLDSLQEAR
jgi:hypothetical protein